MNMADEQKCPFCGSTEMRIETPYVDRITGEKKTTYCCLSQKKNHEYADRNFHPVLGGKTPEEAGKL